MLIYTECTVQEFVKMSLIIQLLEVLFIELWNNYLIAKHPQQMQERLWQSPSHIVLRVSYIWAVYFISENFENTVYKSFNYNYDIIIVVIR